MGSIPAPGTISLAKPCDSHIVAPAPSTVSQPNFNRSLTDGSNMTNQSYEEIRVGRPGKR